MLAKPVLGESAPMAQINLRSDMENRLAGSTSSWKFLEALGEVDSVHVLFIALVF